MRLLERDHETTRLESAVEAARQRHGRVVLVHGPAGIGKSSLVRAFADTAVERDATVRIGYCDDLRAPRAFAPFRDMARGRGPLGEALQRGADRAEVLDALLDEFDDPLRPVVVVLEDLHWADEATLDALQVVGRRISDLPVALIATYRDDEVVGAHPLQRVLAGLVGGPMERISLRPLSREAVGALADRPVADVEDLYITTGGNPFYVHAVLAAPNTAVPPTVRDAVLARVFTLPEATQRALDMLAVMPSGAERSLIDELADGGIRTYDVAERRGLIVADATSVRFAHELARRAVESNLTMGARVTLNAAVANALARREDAAAADVLHHAVEAGDAELALRFGPHAAREAARLGSHREALESYRQLYRFIDRLSPRERAALALEYAYELQLGSRQAEAVTVAREAVAVLSDVGDPLALGDALLVLSRAAYWHGGQAEAMPPANRAVELIDGLAPAPVHAMAYAHMARMHLLANRNADARRWADRALDVAERIGHLPAEAGARISRGAARMNLGEASGSEELQRGLAIAREHGFHETAIRGFFQQVVEDARRGGLDRAQRTLDEGLRYARRHQIAYGVFRLTGLRGCFALARGELHEAREALERSLAYEGEPGMAGVDVRAWLAQTLARLGEPEAQRLADDAWTLARDSDEAPRIGAAAVARVELAWLRQDPAAAETVIEPALTLIDATRHRWYSGDVRVYLQRAGIDVPRAEPDVPMLPAHAAALAGDHAAAAQAWGELGYAYEQAVELLWCDDDAAMLSGVRRLDELGAVGTANVARAMLRSRGIISVPRGPTRRTRRNPANLTDRQVDVLELVAAGLTNAEIAERLVLSVRTVDHHVSAILGKLGVETRQQAADRAGELGVAD
jgi:ATP/maltotriose-dependent transcriptional regulator MalT